MAEISAPQNPLMWIENPQRDVLQLGSEVCCIVAWKAHLEDVVGRHDEPI